MLFIPEKIQLLFIEDDEANANATIELLNKDKHTNFDIIHKSNLKSGIEFLQKECTSAESCSTDIVLLDLMLPNSEGVSTYENLKKACDFLPIVIISMYEDIACQCVKKGAQDFLLKSDLNTGVLTRSLKYAIQRKKVENKLKHSEQKYRELIEATNAGIYEIDFVNDRFTYVNDVMCELTGWTREELMSMGPSSMLTENSMKDWVDRWEALNSGEYIDKTFEYEARMKDGSILWTLVTADFRENKEGLVVGARVVAINITETKMAKEEAERKEEVIFNQLEERIKTWREEISLKTVAHENTLKAISLDINSMATLEVQQ